MPPATKYANSTFMLNIKKTKKMDTDKFSSKTEIEIGNDTIENVKHFEYLGGRFYGDGR